MSVRRVEAILGHPYGCWCTFACNSCYSVPDLPSVLAADLLEVETHLSLNHPLIWPSCSG